MRKNVRTDWRDRITVESDSKHFRLERWDDEVDFEIETLGKERTNHYDITPNKELPEGGYEFESILDEKPKTNVIKYRLKSKGVNFYYQPPLNETKLEEGQTATETEILDEQGNRVAHRPEHIVGSYAVYHATKGGAERVDGKSYKTGKVGHIHRPKIIDDAGNWVWGELEIKGNRLTVTIPQDFLDKAVYPVVVDPTFGYETIGDSSDFTSSGDITIYGSHYTSPDSIIIDRISAAVEESSDAFGYLSALIANHDDGSLKTQDTSCGNIITDGFTWIDRTINSGGSMTNGDEYWLQIALFSAGGYVTRIAYDSGDTDKGAQIFAGTTTTGSFCDQDYSSYYPVDGDWTFEDRKYSIYATYGLPSAPTVTTQAVDNIASTSADGNGNVTDTGGNDVTERGFEYTSQTTTYNESFETDFGNWTNTTYDTWTRNSGGTPSSSTGPSSASDGSYYIYVETSSGEGANNSGDETTIETSCIDGTITFDYHQYGADQGTLYLEGWDGSSWNTVWSSTGDQGDQWNSESHSLSGYTKVRFRNVAAGGYTGDVALDNISVPQADFSSPSTVNETGTFGTGSYSLSLTGLSAGTTYYVKAYAVNTNGTGYGSEVSFTTSSGSTTKTHTLDVSLLKEQAQTHSVDLLTEKTGTKTHTTDLLAKTVNTDTHTTDILAGSVDHTLGSDLWNLKESKYKEHTTDILNFRRETATHGVDIIVQKTEEKSHTVDTLAFLLGEKIHGVDITTVKTNQNTHSVDIIAKTTNEKSHSADLAVQKTETKTHSTDTLAFTRNTKTHSTDLIARTTNESTHSVDVLARKEKSVDHGVDILVRATETATHTLDLLAKTTGVSTHSVDTLTKTTGDKTHLVDLLARSTESKDHTVDIFTSAEGLQVHSVDILARKTKTDTHSVDILAAKRKSSTHTVDLTAKTIQSKSHSTDLLANTTGTESHLVDVTVFKREDKTHSTDLLTQKTVAKTHGVDVLVETEEGVLTHSVDILTFRNETLGTDLWRLKQSKTTTNSTDILANTTEAETHSVDMLVAERKTETHTTDILANTTEEKTHTLDLITKKTRVESNTVDITTKGTFKKTHGIDVYIFGWVYKDKTDDTGWSNKNKSTTSWTHKNKTRSTSWTHKSKTGGTSWTNKSKNSTSWVYKDKN